MAYTTKNFKTKKAVKEAIAAGEEVRVFQPGSFGPGVPENCVINIEGPHYPQPHKWYGIGTVKGGLLVSIK